MDGSPVAVLSWSGPRPIPGLATARTEAGHHTTTTCVEHGSATRLLQPHAWAAMAQPTMRAAMGDHGAPEGGTATTSSPGHGAD